jgi:hypothetical protein
MCIIYPSRSFVNSEKDCHYHNKKSLLGEESGRKLHKKAGILHPHIDKLPACLEK